MRDSVHYLESRTKKGGGNMEQELKVMFREHYRQDIKSIRQEAIECGADPKEVEQAFVDEFYPEFVKQQREGFNLEIRISQPYGHEN